MKKRTILAASLAAAAALCAPAAGAEVTLNVDVASRGPEIGALHYGIFFEEINHAGDGGLYAELIRNRSFEDADSPDAWTKVGSPDWKISNSGLMNEAQNHALELTVKQAGQGIANGGFWGIDAVEGRSYKFSLWVKNPAWEGKLTASLRRADGSDAGSAEISVGRSDSWQKLEATISATASDPKASLQLTASAPGTLLIDMVSLFPPTYKDRPNGCRPDLAAMLEAMRPGFVRFPGGCYIEGQNSSTGHNRFEWKKTIGPVEERPGHWNQSWGYRVSDGLGFHEMLQLTEDLGAEPLFVVNIGMGHGWTVDYLDIDEYVEEALDAIEYCNGDASTRWGAVRAANGHPEPFGLRLLEIGNENYQADASQQSDHYAERYRRFYDAIKARYPEITLIGNVESWGTDNPSWRNSNPVEVVDEHYYRSPSWFVNQYSKYDNYDRTRPKVYVGEYAVTDGYGTNGHLTAALGEAVYMLGMENNSDVCVMQSYAPIFVNENDQKWKPDMIRFDSREAYGTPSYHVQQLMATIRGDRNVRWTESGNLGSTGNKIGLSTWSTVASFDNVRVSRPDGTQLFADDFSADKQQWTAAGGTWTISGGTLNQTDASMQGKLNVASFALPDSYVLELDAIKKSGNEAFLVAFNYGDPDNYCWWNIGGWNNSAHAIEVCSGGAKTSYDKKSGNIATGRTYALKIEVNGGNVRCYIDGELIHDVTLPVKRKIYVASSINKAEDMLILKVVNPGESDVPLKVALSSARATAVEDVTVLTSASGTDENSLDAQNAVAPAAGSADIAADGSVAYTVPAYSLSIIRLRIADAQTAAPGGTPSAEAEAAVREALAPLAKKLAFLHASASLPGSTSTGATIKWALEGDCGGLLSLVEGRWSAMLAVASPLTNTEAIGGATLRATVTYPAGEVSQIELPVTVAPTDGRYGYLYCYMKSNKEITNYALGSKEDRGLRFYELLGGAEIFDTEALAGIEHGTRDAYLDRGQDPDRYFMTTTDMCNAKSGVWRNYGMDLLRSTDLIHWESAVFDFRQGKKIFSDPEATTDAYRSDAEYAKINRVWAPQFIWDPTAMNGSGAYLVYYSLLSSNSGDSHDRIYYSYADREFRTLTQPRVFYDPGYSVIDADIVLNPYDGLYHMFIKHEGASGSNRGIYELTADRLVGADWKEIMHITNEGSELVEGSSAVRRIDEDAYNVYYMRYSGGSAYKVCETDHLGLNAGPAVKVEGKGNFQHGSVITVTRDEYVALQAWSDLRSLLSDVEDIPTDAFDAAIADAKAALELRTVAELARALPEAIDKIKAAREDYVRELLQGDGISDLTLLLTNPNFSDGGNGWSGTGFTAASAGVAEHWNKTFDTYQLLEYMPAGKYFLSCSGFYRYGGKEGYDAHADGSEQLLAKLYINDSEVPFMSLFDESTGYTNSPYTFPDNVSQANAAFNTARNYADNRVSFVLEQTGDLRIGVRKTVAKGSDWTCFDNFRLTYSPDPDSSGIDNVSVDTAGTPDASVDVYSASGILLRRGVSAAEATRGLDPGFYIVGRDKVVVR